MTAWTNRLRQAMLGPDLRSTAKWFLLAAAIGIVAGLGAIVFQLASQAVLHFTLAQVAGYTPIEPRGEYSYFEHPSQTLSPWLVVAVMSVGGLLSGLIVYTFAP